MELEALAGVKKQVKIFAFSLSLCFKILDQNNIICRIISNITNEKVFSSEKD